MLGSLDAQLFLDLTFFAFQPQDNLSRCFGLFVKDGLGLTAESHLFAVVTAFSLREVGSLTRLVLCYLVQHVLLALGTSAVGSAFFGNIHHYDIRIITSEKRRRKRKRKDIVVRDV